jgi:hypothetical protein
MEENKEYQNNQMHAKDCVMRDTLIPAPTFDARQFERTFRFKRYMVRPMISKLVKHHSFWLQTIDCCDKMSMCPLAKVLAAKKRICNDVSFSDLCDYFQMEESEACLCMSKLLHDIANCDDILS